MTKEIKFTRLTNFTGRNGYMKMSGVEILGTVSEEIMLSPITSRGRVGRCDVTIPIEHLPEFIEALVSFVNKNA